MVLNRSFIAANFLRILAPHAARPKRRPFMRVPRREQGVSEKGGFSAASREGHGDELAGPAGGAMKAISTNLSYTRYPRYPQAESALRDSDIVTP
jgi:hypothetical protein